MLIPTYSRALGDMSPPALAGSQGPRCSSPSSPPRSIPWMPRSTRVPASSPASSPWPAGLGNPLCPLLEPTGITLLPENHQDFLAVSLLGVQKSGTRHTRRSGLKRLADTGAHSSCCSDSPSLGSAPPTAYTPAQTHPPCPSTPISVLCKTGS